MEDFTPEQLQAIYDDVDLIANDPDAFLDTVNELEDTEKHGELIMNNYHQEIIDQLQEIVPENEARALEIEQEIKMHRKLIAEGQELSERFKTWQERHQRHEQYLIEHPDVAERIDTEVARIRKVLKQQALEQVGDDLEEGQEYVVFMNSRPVVTFAN